MLNTPQLGNPLFLCFVGLPGISQNSVFTEFFGTQRFQNASLLRLGETSCFPIAPSPFNSRTTIYKAKKWEIHPIFWLMSGCRELNPVYPSSRAELATGLRMHLYPILNFSTLSGCGESNSS